MKILPVILSAILLVLLSAVQSKATDQVKPTLTVDKVDLQDAIITIHYTITIPADSPHGIQFIGTAKSISEETQIITDDASTANPDAKTTENPDTKPEVKPSEKTVTVERTQFTFTSFTVKMLYQLPKGKSIRTFRTRLNLPEFKVQPGKSKSFILPLSVRSIPDRLRLQITFPKNDKTPAQGLQKFSGTLTGDIELKDHPQQPEWEDAIKKAPRD